MVNSIAIAIVSQLVLILMIRRSGVSLGLPIAYLFSLMLIHVPGAIAHVVGEGLLAYREYTEIGIRYTAIGIVWYVIGVFLARLGAGRVKRGPQVIGDPRYPMFCFIGGWMFTFGLARFGQIPSVGAVIQFGGAIWLLGVILGLRISMKRHDIVSFMWWMSVLVFYPMFMLVLGGFLSWGSTAAIILMSGLIPFARSTPRVMFVTVIASVLAFNMFINYYQHRYEIREKVWGGAPMNERIDESIKVVTEFKWFDPDDELQLQALDERLNQNFFVGLAASRIESHDVEFLNGRSMLEGAMALVPRALWPKKPVFGGSPKVVAEMTGLYLDEDSSWGVGNVMEFQINFGTTGLAVGFLLLGLGLGFLDRKAAEAVAKGDLGQVFVYFLPAIALIQPNGSLVELLGGAAASLVAAFGWRWLWREWQGRKSRLAVVHRPVQRHPA